jgi:hypothetical protein
VIGEVEAAEEERLVAGALRGGRLDEAAVFGRK